MGFDWTGDYSFEMAGPIHWPDETLPTYGLGLVRMSDIIAAACVAFDVTEDELKSACRKRCMARARQVVAYIAREHTGFSYPFIAREIGGFDHTTCLWADRKIASMLETDQERMRAKVSAVRTMLRNGNARAVYRDFIARRPVQEARAPKNEVKKIRALAQGAKLKKLSDLGFISGGSL